MYDGMDIKDWVITIAGNIFIVILLFRVLAHYAKKEWGELLTNLLVAVFIAWIVYSNESFIAFLTFMWGKFAGTE